jgi:hypothetical protein
MNKISRRSALKAVALAASLPHSILGQSATAKITAYLESLAREDGGYGWAGQEHSHLTPTFFVIGLGWPGAFASDAYVFRDRFLPAPQTIAAAQSEAD